MKVFIKALIPLLALFFAGCDDDESVDTRISVSIESDGLFQEVVVRLPPEARKGWEIDLYWDVVYSSPYSTSKPSLIRENANRLTTVYDGSKIAFSIFPWNDVSISTSGAYVFRVEAVATSGRQEKMSRSRNTTITPTMIPVLNTLTLSPEGVLLEGEVRGALPGYDVKEHGFFFGHKTYAFEFDAQGVRENYEKIVSNQPRASFRTIREFNMEGSSLYGYAYAITDLGYIFSDYQSYHIRGGEIRLSTGSDFTDLTHERATVYASAYIDNDESGLFSIAEKGFCYINTRQIEGRMPNINDGRLVLEGGEGEYSGTITGLSPGAAYKVAAYAINNIGRIFYSENYVTLPMYTSDAFRPRCSIKTLYDSEPNVTGVVVLEGEINSDRGYHVTERGFCYTVNTSNPTVNDNKIPSGSGLGKFTEHVRNLAPGTYTFRAYGINDAGTGYSDGYYQVKIE